MLLIIIIRSLLLVVVVVVIVIIHVSHCEENGEKKKKRKEKEEPMEVMISKFRTCLICTNALNNSQTAHVLSGVFVTIKHVWMRRNDDGYSFLFIYFYFVK